MQQDPVVSLLNILCRTRGFRVDKEGPGERAIAELVASKLRAFSWLRVEVEDLGDEIFNVLALEGDPSEIELLVVGHLDTVVESPKWTQEPFTLSQDGKRYYGLGAIDTRGGIAAAIDAIGRVGATRKVGYLFYGDEEYQFVGMKEFVRRHPDIAPKLGLSVCGGKGEAYVGWRACTEMEFLFEGVSGHASRAWDGANAAEALTHVMEAVRLACVQFPGQKKTSANIAAVHCGSATGSEKPYVMGRPPQTPPPMLNVANKIPNIGWALLDIRPGDKGVRAAFIEGVARRALAAWNACKQHSVELTVHTNFEMPAFEADLERLKPLFDIFEPVHGGKVRPIGQTGFLDATLIADKHGTQFLCLSPSGDNGHAADEYIEIGSLLAYRDCMVKLLSGYKI